MSALPPELARLSALEKFELIVLLLESIPEKEMALPSYRRDIVRERLDELLRDPDSRPALEGLRTELERAIA